MLCLELLTARKGGKIFCLLGPSPAAGILKGTGGGEAPGPEVRGGGERAQAGNRSKPDPVSSASGALVQGTELTAEAGEETRAIYCLSSSLCHSSLKLHLFNISEARQI